MSRPTALFVVALLVLSPLVGCRDAKTLSARGDRFMTEKKYREASLEYRNALQKDPMLGDVRMKLAEAYYAIGDYPNALRECQRAADLLPDDTGAQIRTGKLLLLAGQYDEAKSRARKALDKNPKDVEAQILLANASAGLKEMGDAIKEMEEAIQLDPKRSLSYANLGVFLASSNSREDAERRFRSAVEIDPKSVNARLALANFLWTTDRPADAEASLKEALNLDPASVGAHRALATLYLSEQRSKEAEPHLKAAADASKDPGLRIVLADYYIAQNRPDDALQLLENVSKEPSGFVLAQPRVAALQYEHGKKEDAYKRIDAVLAKVPSDPPALMTKGRFLLGDGKREEALAKVKAAISANPKYAAAHYLLALLSLPADPTGAVKAFNEVVKFSPRAVDAYLQLARLHLSQGEAGLAVERASEAVRYDPNNLGAHELFARALISHGEFERAAREAQWLQAVAPRRPEGPLLSALVAVARKDLTGASKQFEKALAVDPDSFEALQGLVRLDLAASRADRARTRVRTALDRAPKNSRLHVLAADVAAAQGDLVGVEHALRLAVESDPATLDAYVGLGRLYVSQNRLMEAQKEFESVAAQQPKSIAAHTFVAMAMQAQGRASDAEQRYQQILTIDAGAAIAANNLAMIHLDRGTNLDVALQLAQTAKSHLPDRPEINDTLGWIYYKKGLPAMAVGPLLQATDRSPKNASYQFHAGMALAKAGNKAAAREHLEAALALDAKFAGADEARQTLANLK